MKNNLPATKKDLERFATKEELKAEVAKLATKEDLKRFATKEDLKAVERTLRDEIRFTADETKEEIREEIKQSSSKILNILDSFLVEMKASEEERTVSAHRLSDHEDRIVILEKTAGISPSN